MNIDSLEQAIQDIRDGKIHPWWKGNKNYLSYWFPKLQANQEILDKKSLKLPLTKIFTVPDELVPCFFQDYGQEDWNRVENWLKKEVIPYMDNKQWFIKNGTFSNKFSFENCIVNKYTILEHLMNINYEDCMLDIGGIGEVILREIIPYDSKVVPTIYGGLPLRPEFRVFYNFDTRKGLYVVNYWDYDHCISGMRDKSDIIIFNEMREYLEYRYKYLSNLIFNKVIEVMKNIELTGQWSIDILLEENEKESDRFWLIDMAVAQRSTYWKKDLIK